MNVESKGIPIKSGIYKFTNLTTQKIYIGSAKNLRKRFTKHMFCLKTKTHHSLHFQNAWYKYGEDDFIYEIIEFVDDLNNLLNREQYYLDTLLFAQEYINNKNTKFLELGYNINPTAANRLGSKQSEEAIKKSVLNNDRVFPVMWFDFNGNFKGEFISCGDAEKNSSTNRNSIHSCCTNKIQYTKNGFFIFSKDYDKYKEYFESLKDNPFIPQVWNKGLSIRPEKEDNLILFDRYGRFINTFSYQTDVAKFINCTPGNLSQAKNLKPCKNYLLFDMSYDYVPIIEEIRNKYSFLFSSNKVPGNIMVYDNFNNFITSFDTVEEAADVMDMKPNSIYGVLCGKRKQNEGFIFKYYDDIV